MEHVYTYCLFGLYIANHDFYSLSKQQFIPPHEWDYFCRNKIITALAWATRSSIEKESSFKFQSWGRSPHPEYIKYEDGEFACYL